MNKKLLNNERLHMYDTIIIRLREFFSQEKKHLFFISVLLGIICNITVITNDIMCADVYSVVGGNYFVSGGWDFALGRWMIQYIGKARYGLVMTAVSSIFAIIIMAFLVITVVDLFEIRSKGLQYLTALLCMVSPVFCDTLLLDFCSFEYTVGFFFAVLSVYCVYKWKNSKAAVLAGGVVLSMSIGLYQAYFGVACGLCVLMPLYQLCMANEEIKRIWKNILRSVWMGGIGVAGYFVMMKYTLYQYGMQLADYSGADQISVRNSLQHLPETIIETLRSFYRYFFTDAIVNNRIYKRDYANLVILLGIFLIVISRLWKEKNLQKRVLAAVCVLALLPALGMIKIAAPEREINQLMSAPYMLIYIFGIALISYKVVRITQLLTYGCVLLSLIFAAGSLYVMENASYLEVKYRCNQTRYAAERVTNLIHSNEEYTNDMPVMFVGGTADSFFAGGHDAAKLASGIAVSCPQIWPGGNLSSICWIHYIEYFLGVDFPIVPYEDFMRIAAMEECAQMKLFPDKECVRAINGVMVVKMSDFY